jgi:Derlin-2/3
MPFMFQMFILGRYLNMVEKSQYNPEQPGKTAEMVTFMLFGATMMLVVAYFMGLFFLGPAMSFMVMYVWSRRDPMMDVSFWGFAIKAWHLPFVMVAMAVLMKSSPVLDLVGIAIGHLWCVVKDIIPRTHNINLVWTPDFLYRVFSNNRQPVSAGMPRRGGYRLD